MPFLITYLHSSTNHNVASCYFRDRRKNHNRKFGIRIHVGSGSSLDHDPDSLFQKGGLEDPDPLYRKVGSKDPDPLFSKVDPRIRIRKGGSTSKWDGSETLPFRSNLQKYQSPNAQRTRTSLTIIKV